MGATTQSGGQIDVELPSEWEQEVDEEVRDEISQVTRRTDRAFREANLESDLESVKVKDSGDAVGLYLGRSDERPKEAVMDIASDSSQRDVIAEGKQDESYAHELGHDYFRSLIYQNGGE